MPPGPGKRINFRPRLEVLEDRCLPSTLTVTTTAEFGNGIGLGLGDAVAAAQSGDTIVFAPSLSGQTIVLSQELVVNKSLTIQGLGAQNLTISENNGFNGGTRLFEVDGNGNLTLTGVTLTGGSAGQGDYNPQLPQLTYAGGAILNLGTVTLSNCTISGNRAGAGSLGGGIYNAGTLTLSGSTVSNNWASDGGGIYNDFLNGISAGIGNLTITNSTVTGNTAAYDGGGIYNNGILTTTSSTVTGNSAAHEGGGIYNTDKLTVNNSTVTGNSPDDVYNAGKFQHNHSTVGKVVKD
jgi:predicted outer membrane repeat protein